MCAHRTTVTTHGKISISQGSRKISLLLYENVNDILNDIVMYEQFYSICECV